MLFTIVVTCVQREIKKTSTSANIYIFVWNVPVRRNIFSERKNFPSTQKYFPVRKNISQYAEIFPSTQKYFSIRRNIFQYAEILPSTQKYFSVRRKYQRRLDSCHVNFSTNENAPFSNRACEDFEEINLHKTKKFRKFDYICRSLVIKTRLF